MGDLLVTSDCLPSARSLQPTQQAVFGGVFFLCGLQGKRQGRAKAKHRSNSSHKRISLQYKTEILTEMLSYFVLYLFRSNITELVEKMRRIFLVCNHVTRRPCWGSKQKNISSKNLHENRVQFPEERNAFVLDHQHSRRDVTCKPAILERKQSFNLPTRISKAWRTS